MPIAALLPLLVSILGEAPQVIASVKEIWGLATSSTAPTPAEQQTYDEALDAAHLALQNS